MGTLTNITAGTDENLVFKTGSLTYGGASLGALEGDITWRVERVYDIPQLAGAAGEVIGARHIIEEHAYLTCTLLEWQLGVLEKVIAGVDVSSNVSSEVLGSSEDASDQIGCLDESVYQTVVFTFQQCDGKNTVITLYNAICDGNYEATFRDRGHFSFPVTFKACYDGVDPDARPWAVVHNI